MIDLFDKLTGFSEMKPIGNDYHQTIEVFPSLEECMKVCDSLFPGKFAPVDLNVAYEVSH